MRAVRYKVVLVRNLGILGKICRLASCGEQLKNSPFYAQVAQLGESAEFISWKMRRFKSYLVHHWITRLNEICSPIKTIGDKKSVSVVKSMIESHCLCSPKIPMRSRLHINSQWKQIRKVGHDILIM